MAELEDLNSALGLLDTAISDRIEQLADTLRGRVNIRIAIDVGHGRELAFGKCKGAWTFVLTRADHDTALVSCSRDERLEMVEDGHIEKLIDSAPSLLSEMVPSRRAAIAKLDDLLTRARRAP